MSSQKEMIVHVFFGNEAKTAQEEAAIFHLEGH